MQRSRYLGSVEGRNMYKDQKIAIVVPCFNEEDAIANVIETLPDFVDAIYLIDDASTDKSVENAMATHDPRLEVVGHNMNSGVGRAIATGYKHALRKGADIAVVMAGDGSLGTGIHSYFPHRFWAVLCAEKKRAR